MLGIRTLERFQELTAIGERKIREYKSPALLEERRKFYKELELNEDQLKSHLEAARRAQSHLELARIESSMLLLKSMLIDEGIGRINYFATYHKAIEAAHATYNPQFANGDSGLPQKSSGIPEEVALRCEAYLHDDINIIREKLGLDEITLLSM